MIVTFFLKLGTFFINYFGKLDTLINTLAYVRHFDILCKLYFKLCHRSNFRLWTAMSYVNAIPTSDICQNQPTITLPGYAKVTVI
jgi:hypothetical protein